MISPSPDFHAEIEWRANDTPCAVAFNDIYHSEENGREEKRHVFINGNNISSRWQKNNDFKIAELGFGTGLNFIETWWQWKIHRKEKQKLTYFSVENQFMRKQDARRALERWRELQPLTNRLMKLWENLSDGEVTVDQQTTLRVLKGNADVRVKEIPPKIDAWYLDGFSPSRNPDMWSAELMLEVGRLTVPNGTFATYSAAGSVRRNLTAAGFKVEKSNGYGKKREMLWGIKKI